MVSRDQVRDGARRWAKRLLVALVVLAVLVGAGFLGASFLPRWWSHRIADQAHGGFTGGILVGLFYGFVFTALPLFVLWLTFRKRRAWKTWAWLVGVAVVLAAPNLLTLGVVVGSGSAAHAGQRTLDVDAPGFRGASLAGAIVATIAVLLWVYLLHARHDARAELTELRAELKAQKQKPEREESKPPSVPVGGR